ncbi:MAG: tryptophan-rich sensory protein [Actinobacteria bacterium]|nr:MAG: tryptophan-rich sensory protein [Actinomycetota bacterium]
MGRIKLPSILVFFITYALFSIAGFLFPVDRQWYQALSKPSWTPSGSTIGVVWALLFGLIALSVAGLYQAGALRGENWVLIAVLAANYVFNQGFSYVQFARKDLLLAAADAGLVAATSLALALLSWRHSRLASIALVPYVLWSTFATFLSWTVYQMNR